MLPLRLAAIFVFALFLPISLATGQSGANSAPQAPPLFHADANLVVVDVVVTDHGNPVHGLDRKRFHIFDDGHEQSISAFDEHQPAIAPAPEATAALAAKIAALPPHTYTNVPLYPEATAVNVLLLDGLNTPMANQQEARRQMIDYMSKITPGTSLAIFTLSSQLRMVEGFTTNTAVLAKALKSKSSIAGPSVVLDSKSESAQRNIDDELSSMVDGSASGPSPESVAALEQFQTDLTATQTDLRVHMTLDAMQQLARYLSAIPGRKNLIWFSGSFPISLDPDSEQALPFLAVRTYADEIKKTSELMAAARVAVYPVDARGMMTQSTADAAYSPNATRVTVNNGGKVAVHIAAMNDSNLVHDYETFMVQTMEQHGSMQQIAQETGGVATINSNDLKDAVAKAVENGACYYSIAFVPGDKKFNGRYHRLRMALESANYKLAYRSGYFVDATNKPSAHNPGVSNLISSATLRGAPASTQILFRAQVLSAKDPELNGFKFQEGPAGEMAASLKGPTQRYLVGLLVDPHGINLNALPNGVRQAQLEFILVAYDAEGKRLNYVDRSYAINIKPEEFEQRMTNGILARLSIDLPAGQSYLRIAVQDLSANRAGSLEVPITVAAK